MSTVLLEALKKGDPDLMLGFLCEEGHGPALTGHPCLDRLHLLQVQRTGADARARGKVPGGGGVVRGPQPRGGLGLIKEIRSAHYDLAVDLFFNPRSSWLLWATGIPRRICGTRGSRRRLFSHSILRGEVASNHPGFNSVAPGGLGEHLARLAPLVHGPTGLDFPDWLTQTYRSGELRPRLARRPLGSSITAITGLGVPGDQPFVVLAPGATWRSKEWPLAHWRELVARLVEHDRKTILVLSPPGFAKTWDGLGEGIPSGRGGVLPVLGLDEVLAVLGAASLLVTVDGGVMHTGVGLGVPTVGLFGPTRPDAWFPYENAGPFRVLCTRPPCHPCNLHECKEFICLPDLLPEAVLAAIKDLQERLPEPGGQ